MKDNYNHKNPHQINDEKLEQQMKPGWVTSRRYAYGFQNTTGSELLYCPLSVESERHFLIIWFNATNVMWSSRPKNGHQVTKGITELKLIFSEVDSEQTYEKQFFRLRIPLKIFRKQRVTGSSSQQTVWNNTPSIGGKHFLQ